MRVCSAADTCTHVREKVMMMIIVGIFISISFIELILSYKVKLKNIWVERHRRSGWLCAASLPFS